MAMWNRLLEFIRNHDGHFVIFGDLNKVRDESERYGTDFCRSAANVFNAFIDDARLFEPVLGGRNFTWMNKAGTKMSKSDRFLISRHVTDVFTDVKVTALPRGWSDHTPIMLHCEKVDYGPVSFKLFHSWLQQDGFDDCIKIAYNECSAMPFHEKLKVIKQHIKCWTHQVKNVEIARKQEIISKVSDIEANIDFNTASEVEKVDQMKFLKERDDLQYQPVVPFSTLSQEDNMELEKPVTLEEIRAAVWDCGSQKSPDQLIVMTGGTDVAETSLSCVKCGKPANLQCPKCVELKLPREGAAFCTQDCFKASWGTHKSVHLKAKLASVGSSKPWELNVASPSDGWLYCLRKGQSRTAQTPNFDWTGPLRPYPISKKRVVPAGIELPDWALDGNPKIEPISDLQHVVEIKSPEMIERMRETNRIAREVLDAGARAVRVGVTTDEIDAVVHEATIAAGMSTSQLLRNFFVIILLYGTYIAEPIRLRLTIIFSQSHAARRSVNEVICHGIPDGRKLEDGDIVNIDVSIYYKGVHGEELCPYTYVVKTSGTSQQLVKCTYECMEKAIAIDKASEEIGCGLMLDFCYREGQALLRLELKFLQQDLPTSQMSSHG
ncbi:methionine aminopeptidase 1A [Tanacetum coccineum]